MKSRRARHLSLGLLLSTGAILAGCYSNASVDAPGAAVQALNGVEGTFEFAIDAPWRMEPSVVPIVGSTTYSYGQIPLQITVHDADQVSFDAAGASSTPTIGKVCELAVTEGTTRTVIPVDQFAEIERMIGPWLWPASAQPSGPARDVCTRTSTANCASLRGVTGTSEWHATALYSPRVTTPGANVALTLDLKVSRSASIDCTNTTASNFYRLRNYARVHLGEAPLPRPAAGWAYGDLHYHSQGTNNEGESGYNYRGTAYAMRSVGIDFLWATEHASASEQIVDSDLELNVVAYTQRIDAWARRGVLRDMDSRRFRAMQSLVAQANRDAALRAPSPNILSLGFNGIIPQIFLGGELDAVPELQRDARLANTAPPTTIAYGANRTFNVAELCGGWQTSVSSCVRTNTNPMVQCLLGSSACSAASLWRDAGNGALLIGDVQGINEYALGREHMVYFPDPTLAATVDPFVPSRTSVFGGAQRRLADPTTIVDPTTGASVTERGVLTEVEEKRGTVFLAHHMNSSNGGSGPGAPPWPESMIRKAWSSPAVAGFEFWNENARRRSTVYSDLRRSTDDGFEDGYQRDSVQWWHDLQLVDQSRRALRPGSDGLFELYPFDVFNGRYGGATSETDEVLNDGAFSWDAWNVRGLDSRETAALSAWLPVGQPRRMFMAGGSDAHGDFNYHRSGYMTGMQSVFDAGIGSPRNLVMAGAPNTTVTANTRPVYGAAQVRDAVRAGHFAVTDGPALRIVYDRNENGVIDDTDPMMGDVVDALEVPDAQGRRRVPLLIEWQSSPEFGHVQSIEFVVGAFNSATGTSRIYTGGEGTVPTTTPTTDAYDDNGWHYRRNARGYWYSEPVNYLAPSDPAHLAVQWPDGTCSTCYRGVRAVSLDLSRIHVTPGVRPDRLFVRAFAATERAAQGSEALTQCASADSASYRQGRCIRRYAFTNPIWVRRIPFVTQL